jgi:hypothetical protein
MHWMNFRTGLVAIDYFQYPRFPYVGNGWQVVLAPPAARSTTSVSYGGKMYPGREVIIKSPTENSAQTAADLLTAALLAIDVSAVRSQVLPGEHSPIVAIPNIRAMEDEASPTRQIRLATMGTPLACFIAARASKRLRLVYSMSKLRFSLDTLCLLSNWTQNIGGIASESRSCLMIMSDTHLRFLLRGLALKS